MFRRHVTHPVTRQFILRSAVLNYLGKCLQREWDKWSRLNAQFTKKMRLKGQESLGEEALQKLAQLIEELQAKAAVAHRRLQREYDELFTYMMDKRDLWDSPEYFNAKTALGTANYNLRTFVPKKPNREGELPRTNTASIP